MTGEREPTEADMGIATSYMSAVRKAPFALIECAGKPDALEVAAWNETATRVFGFTRQEVMGRSLRGTILSDADSAEWRRLFEEESGAAHLSTNTRKDGSHVTCEWFFEPVLDERGRPARMLCFGQDVTRRLEEAAMLREQGLVLRTILDNLPIVMAKVAHDGTILVQEGKGLQAGGLKPGQLIGTNVFDLYVNDPSVAQTLRRGLAGESVHSITEAHGAAWEAWVAPIRDERGDVRSIVITSLDVSDAKRREVDLRAKLDLIERQQRVIRDLSIPIIEVWDSVLTLPMVGVVDSLRTSEVMDSLLAAIVSKGARYAILDLTGVDAVDTKTASYLIDLVRAIRLLGAEGVITGIRSNVAQTMVTLGLDLSGIATKGNLRAGLKLCLQRMAAADDSAGAPGRASLPTPK